MTQRETQETGLGVMISRCSADSQQERPGRHPANFGCSFFRYATEELRNHTNQRGKCKTSIREDNRLAGHCHFRSNPTQRVRRKRMIDNWQEYASFQTTSQRLADQVRTIRKTCWFSDLEILEIYQKINNERYSNAARDTSGFNSQTEINRQILNMDSQHNLTTQNLKTPNKYLHQNTRLIQKIFKDLWSVKRLLSLRNI